MKAIFLRPSAYSRRGGKRSLRSCFSTTSRKPDRSLPNRAYVYAANRLHNSIAVFAVGTQGHLGWVGEAWTQGDYRVSSTWIPAAHFCMHATNGATKLPRSNVKETGLLTFTRRYTRSTLRSASLSRLGTFSFRARSQMILLLPILKPKPTTDVQHIGRIVFRLDGFYRRSALMWSNLAH